MRKLKLIVGKLCAVTLIAAMLTGTCTHSVMAASSRGGGAYYNGMDYSDVYDYNYYKDNNPDLVKAFGNNKEAYIKHFVEKGMSEGREASENFDIDYYISANGDLQETLGNDTKAYYIHYINSGKNEGRQGSAHAVYNGMDYSDVYDYAYYRGNNPDLEEVFGDNIELYIEHFVNTGMAEKRKASEKFDIDVYMQNYPDLVKSLGSDYKMYYIHYINSGKAEGREAEHLLSDINSSISWIDRGGERYCIINGEYAKGWHEINGRWYYFNDAGQLKSRFGIDVSFHNGDINWQAAYQDGVEFAIIRIGYGENLEEQDDIKAMYNIMACEWLGIPYGVYLYSYALTEADVQSEVDHVIRVLNGKRPPLGVYIDMEDADGYKGRRNALNNTTLQNICSDFVKKFTAMGYKSGIYANYNWFEKKLDRQDISTYPNWVAQWGRPCEYTGNYELWQASSRGRVNGIEGYVDIDAWLYED